MNRLGHRSHRGYGSSMKPFLVSFLMMLAASSAAAQEYFFGFDAVEWHDRIDGRELTYPFDIFCLQKPGFLVEISWEAISDFGDASQGQMPVVLYEMAMIECPHGWDLHEMGNVWVDYGMWPGPGSWPGPGGHKWVAVYGDNYLVRFSAWRADIKYDDDGNPVLHAVVHPLYCNNEADQCEVQKPLPMFMPDE
jgi:hypothetical protein